MTRPGLPSTNITAVLDIGTAKTVCLIAAAPPPRGPPSATADTSFRILGIGHQQSRGIKAGAVIDMAEAEGCLRATIAQAERIAGLTLDRVYVSVSCGRLKSHAVTASAEVSGSHVTTADLSRLMSGARAYLERDGRQLVHFNRKAVTLDGTASDGNLIGMAAKRMSSVVHAVSADEAPIRNLSMVLERCHLGIMGLLAAPFASAMAVTTAQERQHGITVIDIGAGTTKLAAFSDGQFEHIRSVPLGGGLVTTDIARALHTPLIEAERIKALYGNLLSARSDEHEGFSYPSVFSDENVPMQHATRAELARVMRPRIAEILLTVATLPDGKVIAGKAGEPLVLTGGGSLLAGIAEFASGLLERNVRVGQNAEISGLPPVARTPAFSTVTGLLLALGGEHVRPEFSLGPANGEQDGYMQRVGAWLKSGF